MDELASIYWWAHILVWPNSSFGGKSYSLIFSLLNSNVSCFTLISLQIWVSNSFLLVISSQDLHLTLRELMEFWTNLGINVISFLFKVSLQSGHLETFERQFLQKQFLHNSKECETPFSNGSKHIQQSKSSSILSSIYSKVLSFLFPLSKECFGKELFFPMIKQTSQLSWFDNNFLLSSKYELVSTFIHGAFGAGGNDGGWGVFFLLNEGKFPSLTIEIALENTFFNPLWVNDEHST